MPGRAAQRPAAWRLLGWPLAPTPVGLKLLGRQHGGYLDGRGRPRWRGNGHSTGGGEAARVAAVAHTGGAEGRSAGGTEATGAGLPGGRRVGLRGQLRGRRSGWIGWGGMAGGGRTAGPSGAMD